MKLVPSAAANERKLILVAPPEAEAPDCFREPIEDRERCSELLADVQKLRGEVYLEGGFITPEQLTADGRHRLEADQWSWHLVLVDNDGQVRGCARYMQHKNTVSFSELDISNSTLAQCERWGGSLRTAVEGELARARKLQVPYVELGGWVLIKSLRCSVEALRMALAAYGLSQILGGGLGITTARRQVSAPILRKIGGHPLTVDEVPLPAYFDPHYHGETEVLRFDSSAPNPKYRHWVDQLRAYLLTAPVVCGRVRPRARRRAIGFQQLNYWPATVR
jgi:hypothetical protein